ncbi:MAG: SMC family ATPase [Gemmatimonadota bacterium]|nr:SMC family ATPase [Gemmatimonadota bacterium]
MKILSVHLQNFRLHADTQVDFTDGITGIIGSNESGKSALLEAIVWALFGAKATRGTMGGLRWWGAPARRTASVTLRFELGGKVYRIDRSESTATLHDEAGGLVLAESTDPVNKEVPKLIGMTLEQFSASYLVLQKDVARIASMGPTDRQAFVRSVMGVGKIDTGLDACRKRKNKVANEIEGIEAGLGQREPLEQAVTFAEADYARCHAEVEAQEQSNARATEALQGATEALADSTSRKEAHERHALARQTAQDARDAAILEVERLEAKLAGVEAAQGRLDVSAPAFALVDPLRLERDQLKDARATASERRTLVEREGELVQQVAEIEEALASARAVVETYDPDVYEAANVRAGELHRTLDALRVERQTRRANRLAAAQHHTERAAELARKIAVITEAGVDGSCPTCTRRLGDQFAAVMEYLEGDERVERELAIDAGIDAEDLDSPSDDELSLGAEVIEAEEEVERLVAARKHRDAAADVIRELEQGRRLTTAQASLADTRARLAALPTLTFSPERLSEVEAELGRIEELDRALAPDRALVAQVDETRERLAERRALREQAILQIEEAEAQIAYAGFDATKHETLVVKEAGARATHGDTRVALARAQEAGRGVRTRLADAVRAVADYDARAHRLIELREEHRVHVLTDRRLAEFRAAIVATIRPEMEELMSGFVHLLTDGRHESVTLTDDFQAVLHESGVPAEVVSGGTEDIAALAMRLAISQMIAERAGHPLELLILDEPFGSLDETRRGSVLALLRRLRSTFRQVIVISHVAETRDMVDHAVEFEFDEPAGRTRLVSGPAAILEVA